MRKILFYITYFPGYGGIKKVTSVLAECLSARGYDVRILSFADNSHGGQFPSPQGVKVDFMPDRTNFLSEKNRRFLTEYLHTHDFDRIVYQDCYFPIHELLFATDFPVREKLIVAEHNSPLCYLTGYENYWRHLYWFSLHGFPRKVAYFVRKHQIRGVSARRHRLLIENCRSYILLSEAYRKQLEELVGSGFDERIAVVANPVTTPRNPHKDLEKEQSVLFVGRLVRDKGVGYLPEIWELVAKRNPGWTLEIVGEGELRPEIERQIAERGIQRVHLAGAQADMRPFYERASILVMTSLFEGFPLVLLEAMDHGCVPVVFDSFAALDNVVCQGRNGYRIAPYEVDEFARKLSALMKNPARRAAMSRGALQTAGAFSIEAVCGKWAALLEQ